MKIDELVTLIAEPLDVAIVITDAQLDDARPLIRYVNSAFVKLTGYDRHVLLGQSPGILHGARTNPGVVRAMGFTLREGQIFHGYVDNYRQSGEHYMCELCIHPIGNNSGGIEAFIGFAREVRRRRGRPSSHLGRFLPVDAENPTVSKFFNSPLSDTSAFEGAKAVSDEIRD